MLDLLQTGKYGVLTQQKFIPVPLNGVLARLLRAVCTISTPSARCSATKVMLASTTHMPQV